MGTTECPVLRGRLVVNSGQPLETPLVLVVNVSVGSGAPLSARSITVINPDGGRSTVLNAFTPIRAAPIIASVNPSSRGRGASTESIVITGSNFGSAGWSNSSVAFSGGGVTVNSVTRNSATKLTVNISIAAGATTGARDVTVRNTDGGRTTKLAAFTVNTGPGWPP